MILSSLKERKIPVSVMMAHLLTAQVPFEFSSAWNMYMPVGEGQESEIYEYLKYVGKIQTDLENLGVWDRLSRHACSYSTKTRLAYTRRTIGIFHPCHWRVGGQGI